MFNNIIDNMFETLFAIQSCDLAGTKSIANTGFKGILNRPHNLYVDKDEQGNIVSYRVDIVYTPFKKSECKVMINKANELVIMMGKENKVKDESLVYGGISHQSAKYVIPLCAPIDTDKCNVTSDEGILTITLPVKKDTNPDGLVLEIK